MDEVDLKAILVKPGKDLAESRRDAVEGQAYIRRGRTEVALADTHANQEEYPQPSE